MKDQFKYWLTFVWQTYGRGKKKNIFKYLDTHMKKLGPKILSFSETTMDIQFLPPTFCKQK